MAVCRMELKVGRRSLVVKKNGQKHCVHYNHSIAEVVSGNYGSTLADMGSTGLRGRQTVARHPDRGKLHVLMGQKTVHLLLQDTKGLQGHSAIE